MSKRSEEAALKAYPDESFISVEDADMCRSLFQEGYEQAEKDIISLIESRISEILGDAQPSPVLRIELQGIIDKIKNCI